MIQRGKDEEEQVFGGTIVGILKEAESKCSGFISGRAVGSDACGHQTQAHSWYHGQYMKTERIEEIAKETEIA